MGRPNVYRKISNIKPKINFYCPIGVPIREMRKIFISADEFEALRLRDYDHIKQTEAAEKMNISQATYSRIVRNAAEKMIKAFIEGLGIVIQTHSLEQECPYVFPGGRNRQRGEQFSQGQILKTKKNPLVSFKGFGCHDCGFEWSSYEFDSKNMKKGQKINCPECNSKKTYRLIKKLQ